LNASGEVKAAIQCFGSGTAIRNTASCVWGGTVWRCEQQSTDFTSSCGGATCYRVAVDNDSYCGTCGGSCGVCYGEVTFTETDCWTCDDTITCGSCSTGCGPSTQTCSNDCGYSYTNSCGCNICCSAPYCGQDNSCGGSCSNVDNGAPVVTTVVSPNGTAAAPTPISTSTVTLVWNQNTSTLTDGYNVEVYTGAGSLILNRNVAGRATTSTTTGVLSAGLYYWRIRAYNTTCGTDNGPWSSNYYFRINSPPTLNTAPTNYLILQNSVSVVVPPEAGSRNHICQTTFTTAPATPRRIKLVVTATDADGGSNISSVSVRLNVGTSANSSGGVTGDWSMVSPVTNSVSGNNRTYTFYMNLGNSLDSNTLYNLEATATDAWGATTGWVDSGRDFKSWDCKVTVSGGMYDGSAGAVCTTTTGYTTYVDDDFNFQSLRFNKISDNSKVEMSVTRPATYNSGGNYLLWGNSYNTTDTDFNYVVGDGELAGTIPQRRVSGGSMGAGVYSCLAIDLTNSSMIDPYGTANTLVADFSSTVNQEAWWQVEGGGIRMTNTVSNMVPVTCAIDSGGCRAAMSVDDILLTNSNGLVSGAIIGNDSGCGDLCRIGLTEDRYYTANLLNKTYSYSVLRQEYLLKYGEGVEVSNNWGNIVANTTDKVFFVNENLVIDSNLTLLSNEFKMVIVSGNITIDPSVTWVDGIYLANNGFVINGTNSSQLVIQGILHTSGGNVNIGRSYVNGANNNTSPAVVIKYRPDIIFSMPANLTRALSGWKGGI